MQYSVYSFAKGLYDYYEDQRDLVSLNAPKPTHLQQRTLGSTVDQAAWPLPPDAKLVGSGPVAIGRVAGRGGGGGALGAITISSPVVKAGMLVGAAALIWKFVVKPRGRR